MVKNVAVSGVGDVPSRDGKPMVVAGKVLAETDIVKS